MTSSEHGGADLERVEDRFSEVRALAPYRSTEGAILTLCQDAPRAIPVDRLVQPRQTVANRGPLVAQAQKR